MSSESGLFPVILLLCIVCFHICIFLFVRRLRGWSDVRSERRFSNGCSSSFVYWSIVTSGFCDSTGWSQTARRGQTNRIYQGNYLVLNGRVVSFVYLITSDRLHMFTIKVQVIPNRAHRPSMHASYLIGSGTTMQKNQPAVQIAAKHSLSSDGAIYVMNLLGAGGNRSRGLVPGRRES